MQNIGQSSQNPPDNDDTPSKREWNHQIKPKLHAIPEILCRVARRQGGLQLGTLEIPAIRLVGRLIKGFAVHIGDDLGIVDVFRLLTVVIAKIADGIAPTAPLSAKSSRSG